jgi:hypothetical protein
MYFCDQKADFFLYSSFSELVQEGHNPHLIPTVLLPKMGLLPFPVFFLPIGSQLHECIERNASMYLLLSGFTLPLVHLLFLAGLLGLGLVQCEFSLQLHGGTAKHTVTRKCSRT